MGLEHVEGVGAQGSPELSESKTSRDARLRMLGSQFLKSLSESVPPPFDPDLYRAGTPRVEDDCSTKLTIAYSYHGPDVPDYPSFQLEIKTPRTPTSLHTDDLVDLTLQALQDKAIPLTWNLVFNFYGPCRRVSDKQ